MSRTGRDLLDGMKNVVSYLEGRKEGSRKHVVRVPTLVDVGAIRKRLKLTQERFANEYGFTLSAIKDWEQGRRTPERSARILLKIIGHDPTIVHRALNH